jgi:hypothetical protein
VLRAIARDEYLPMSIADAVSWHGGDCTSSESYHGHSEDGLRSEAGPLAGKLVVFTERPSVTAEALLGKGFRREFRGSYGSRRDERGVTLVWVDDGAVLAHGPAFEAVADWLRPWHELRHPTWATLTDDILSAGANPWHLEAQLGYPDAEVWRPSRDVLGARWSESAPATGPSFASVVLAWCRMEQIRLAEFLTDPAGDPVVRWEEHDPEPVRTLLARWAGRPSRAIPSGVELHLLLRQSARCEVVCVPPRDGELLRAFIDLGGKTLIEIRAVALRGTATPFVPAASFGPRDPAPTHEALELLGLPPDARKTWRWGPDSARIASSPRILFEGGDVALGVLRHDCDLQWGRNTGR